MYSFRLFTGHCAPNFNDSVHLMIDDLTKDVP